MLLPSCPFPSVKNTSYHPESGQQEQGPSEGCTMAHNTWQLRPSHFKNTSCQPWCEYYYHPRKGKRFQSGRCDALPAPRFSLDEVFDLLDTNCLRIVCHHSRPSALPLPVTLHRYLLPSRLLTTHQVLPASCLSSSFPGLQVPASSSVGSSCVTTVSPLPSLFPH